MIEFFGKIDVAIDHIVSVDPDYEPDDDALLQHILDEIPSSEGEPFAPMVLTLVDCATTADLRAMLLKVSELMT